LQRVRGGIGFHAGAFAACCCGQKGHRNVSALALAAPGTLDRGAVALFGGVLRALSVITYLPMGVMLAAIASVSFAYRAFPRWRVWFSTAASLAHFVLTLWFYAQDPGGWAFFAWLFPVPDLSLAAYLAGPRAGATAYNLVVDRSGTPHDQHDAF
jgi:hypothetical protein